MCECSKGTSILTTPRPVFDNGTRMSHRRHTVQFRRTVVHLSPGYRARLRPQSFGAVSTIDESREYHRRFSAGVQMQDYFLERHQKQSSRK